MRWHNGNVSVAHAREPWEYPGPQLLVHCRYDEMKGTFTSLAADRQEHVARYEAAKRNFDMNAAFDIIERCVRDHVIEQIVDVVIQCEQTPRLVFPHPAFDDEDGFIANSIKEGGKATNAIPFAYAAYLSKITGCPIDDGIVQAARVGRTKLKTWLRFLCQPSFRGEIRATHPYIIVDDVATTGGTCAALRSFIVRNGGTVPVVTALGHKTGAARQELAINSRLVSVLIETYGAGIESYWLEAIGHEIQCLTYAEGEFLAQWANAPEQVGTARGDDLLQRLRDRINQAAATGG